MTLLRASRCKDNYALSKMHNCDLKVGLAIEIAFVRFSLAGTTFLYKYCAFLQLYHDYLPASGGRELAWTSPFSVLSPTSLRAIVVHLPLRKEQSLCCKKAQFL